MFKKTSLQIRSPIGTNVESKASNQTANCIIVGPVAGQKPMPANSVTEIREASPVLNCDAGNLDARSAQLGFFGWRNINRWR